MYSYIAKLAELVVPHGGLTPTSLRHLMKRETLKLAGTKTI
jgi:hypothetical protein